jgi:hypothetical protein
MRLIGKPGYFPRVLVARREVSLTRKLIMDGVEHATDRVRNLVFDHNEPPRVGGPSELREDLAAC